MESQKKNLSAEVWGPCGWIFLHSISYSYPEDPSDTDKKQYSDFLYSLKHVIPCEKCSKHYSEYIQEFPPLLNSRNDFTKWMIDLHNNVNIDNKKKVLSYEEVHKKYMELYQQEKKLNPLTDDDFDEIKLCFALMIMVIITFVIWKVVK
jgi:hypothetical protein